MQKLVPENLTFTEVSHLPILKAYAKKINIVDTIDHIVESQMELSPGIAVLAMVLDTLSGRTPLYRLKEFFHEKDTELILGEPVEPEQFSDHNLGRVLDKLYETGTQRIFSQIAQHAVSAFAVDTRNVHFDTTSISVYGDYDMIDPPFNITYGHSKDKRPDLKQFLVSMLCVDRNIPILGTPKDGNASDKTVNNELLTNISKHMARYGLEPGAFVYVGDSAMITKDNLRKIEEKNTRFLSRLPATYGECSRVIRQAVASDNWINVGPVAEGQGTQKRPAAKYRFFETTVDLYDKIYRAIVVHSSAHDRRRHKRIDRLLTQKRKELETLCKKTIATTFFCRADAETAAQKLINQTGGSYHKINCKINEVAKFARGRPAKDKPRTPMSHEYALNVEIIEDSNAVTPLRLEAGCFVLITNLSTSREKNDWPPTALLKLYKNQNGIEKNFGFLKDPVIVNSIFLKNHHRIEVLGLVLLIALLIWRLMERCMRQHIKTTGKTITGWEDRPTKKPTAFMMTTKFTHILVAKSGNQRELTRPLSSVQLEYLKALKVEPYAYTVP
jgi:transposase